MKTRSSTPSARHIGGMTITKVVREHKNVSTDESGTFQTIGQMLDENLHMRLTEGEVIQDIAFHFDTESPDAMKCLAAMYGITEYYPR